MKIVIENPSLVLLQLERNGEFEDCGCNALENGCESTSFKPEITVFE
jgi:hypothetical protein